MANPIRVLKLWTDYPVRDGKRYPVDMIEYCAPGMAGRSTTETPVLLLQKLRPNPDPDNPADKLVRNRWEAIRPTYEAWKAGQEVPLHGTPLAAWSGIAREQADVIRTAGIKTVEELAEAADSVLGRIQLPGMRDLAEHARRFIASSDQTKVADDLLRKDNQINDLQSQLEEMRQIVLEMQRESEPKRRGRPPKVHAEAESHEADEVAA